MKSPHPCTGTALHGWPSEPGTKSEVEPSLISAPPSGTVHKVFPNLHGKRALLSSGLRGLSLL